MTETIRESHTEADSAAAVLGFVRDQRALADRAEAKLLQAAVSWVGMHSVDSIDQAATVWDRTYGDTGITVAGPGAPLVAEFSVARSSPPPSVWRPRPARPTSVRPSS